MNSSNKKCKSTLFIFLDYFILRPLEGLIRTWIIQNITWYACRTFDWNDHIAIFLAKLCYVCLTNNP